jgi:hypothetical protein
VSRRTTEPSLIQIKPDRTGGRLTRVMRRDAWIMVVWYSWVAVLVGALLLLLFL